jgi:hypothetical protein
VHGHDNHLERPLLFERRTNLDTAAAEAVLAPNKNIENNPMQSRMRSLAWMICPRKIFDTSGKSPAHFQYRAT